MMSETEQAQVAQLLAKCAAATGSTGVTSVGCGQGEVLNLVHKAGLATIGIDLCDPRGAALQLGLCYKGLYPVDDPLTPLAGAVSWSVVARAGRFNRSIDVDPLHVLLFNWGTRAPFQDYINQYVAAEGKCVVTVWNDTCKPTGDEVGTQLDDEWVRADTDINGTTFSVFKRGCA